VTGPRFISQRNGRSVGWSGGKIKKKRKEKHRKPCGYTLFILFSMRIWVSDPLDQSIHLLHQQILELEFLLIVDTSCFALQTPFRSQKQNFGLRCPVSSRILLSTRTFTPKRSSVCHKFDAALIAQLPIVRSGLGLGEEQQERREKEVH